MHSEAVSAVRDLRRVVAAMVASVLLMAGLSSAPAAAEGAERLVSVIVQGLSPAGVDAAVTSVGGRVTQPLPIINGVTASVPSSSLDKLRSAPAVVQVTPNDPVSFQGKPAPSPSPTSSPSPSPSPTSTTSPNNVYVPPTKVVRSDALWKSKITGKGVTVALLDTGVYAAQDLAGRVVACEDFSHERATEANCADTFGHGTFMAGLIAGNGAASAGKYKGAAPEAKIVSVKAAGYDGSTDISTILAGIQWVVAHKDTYGIRVLNLSLGSDSSQDYRLSPLNYAVERAWQAGIVVVVSAGNSGPGASTVMKPGDDPFVITVGSSNSEGTLDIKDDRVPVFSSRGPTRSNSLAKPDVLSPGVHTISLRSPGSAIDFNYGSTATVSTHYFKGTGTSMSTATVSGVVAQMLQKTPTLNPNQVKNRLLSTARPIVDRDVNSVGKGLIDATAAANSTSLVQANQGIDPATGLGSIQGDRGTIDVEVVTPAGQIALTGEFSAQTNPAYIDPVNNPGGLVPFSSVTYTTSGWDPTTWQGTSWKTEDWAGTSWKGTSWKATVWDGTSWKGTSWKNADWDGTSWKNVDWDGTSWKGTSWKSYWYAAAWD